MTNIVAYLRQHGQAADNEEFNNIVYWTDDQLEEIADTWSVRQRVPIDTAQQTDPTIYRIRVPRGYVMEDDFVVFDAEDETATEITSPVATYAQTRNELEFATALDEDTQYYVEALFICINDALADLWSQKASQRFDYIDFKAGNNKMNMSQERDYCEKRAAYYRAKTIRRWPRQSGKWVV
jgi:hypothetical protein